MIQIVYMTVHDVAIYLILAHLMWTLSPKTNTISDKSYPKGGATILQLIVTSFYRPLGALRLVKVILVVGAIIETILRSFYENLASR